jgi:Protein of unknown function (DUF4232)
VTTRALIAAGISLTGFVAVTLSVVAYSVRAATPAPTCTADQLRLRPTLYGEAGGQFIQTFTFTNEGANACRLAGWPTLRAVDASGHSEPAPSIRVVQGKPAAKPFDTVVVQPGSVAAFDIFGADYDALANRACPKTRALLVAAPGVAPSRVTIALPFCGPFYVAPVIAGKSDRDAWSGVWATRWCRMQQFTVSIGRRISEATGQHTLALRLTNHRSACTLYGVPAMWFEDAHGRIPFELRSGTDQMIAAPYALPVQVRRGGSAWVVINHYRCDVGTRRAANLIRIGLQDAAYPDTITVTVRNPYSMVDYCGKGDPGSTITVAPFEPTLTAAFHH